MEYLKALEHLYAATLLCISSELIISFNNTLKTPMTFNERFQWLNRNRNPTHHQSAPEMPEILHLYIVQHRGSGISEVRVHHIRLHPFDFRLDVNRKQLPLGRSWRNILVEE